MENRNFCIPHIPLSWPFFWLLKSVICWGYGYVTSFAVPLIVSILNAINHSSAIPLTLAIYYSNMLICIKNPSFSQILLYYPEIFIGLYSSALFRVIGDFESNIIIKLCTSRIQNIIVENCENAFLNIREEKTNNTKEMDAQELHKYLFFGYSLLPLLLTLALLRPISSAAINKWYDNHSTRVKVSICNKIPAKNHVEVIQENHPEPNNEPDLEADPKKEPISDLGNL
ncbi:228_t:CDS:2 [Gigaspora rosea]|nr:228_t:CDS:2 [Gigaspora rosea]